MKVTSLALAGLSLALIALTLVPSAGSYRAAFAVGALICAAVVLITIVTGWHERPAASGVAADAGRSTPPAPPAPARSVPVAAPATSAEAEVLAVLAALQEKGRLIDFLQDEIAGYTDAQVGAAARVVHQGCRAALAEIVRIVPVRAEDEGSRVTVPAQHAADEYRLVGTLSGSAPFTGTLMHRGWKAESVTLPRVLRDAARLPTIAPAEVELR